MGEIPPHPGGRIPFYALNRIGVKTIQRKINHSKILVCGIIQMVMTIITRISSDQE